jgi:phospholipase/carboxylesterase
MSLSGLLLSPKHGSLPQALVLLLHGWGSNAEDVAGLAPVLELGDSWVTAPDGPMAHPYSEVGKMWYDLEDPAWPGLKDSKALLVEHLEGLIQESGLTPAQTVIMGFSQGGAMALEVGLSLPLGGIAVFSGYLHPDLAQQEICRPTAPLFITHGRQDAVVPFRAAEQTCQFLEACSATFEFKPFDMGHEISLDALAAARQWFRQLPLGR